MKGPTKHFIGMWEIDFSANVHMYCHNLKATKGNHSVNIPCEDQPIGGNFVGIWLYASEASEAHQAELLPVLLEWATVMRIKCNVYSDKDTFKSNV